MGSEASTLSKTFYLMNYSNLRVLSLTIVDTVYLLMPIRYFVECVNGIPGMQNFVIQGNTWNHFW